MLPAVALPGARHERFSDLKARLQTAPGGPATALEHLVPTGVATVDALLGGGLPAGALVTLEGPRSSGRWSVVASLLAGATRCGLGAVIDDGELYPPSLEAAGVRLDRLLVVPARSAVGIARAADLLLRSRVVRVLVMTVAALRAAVWTRLAALAQRAGAVLVVVTTQAWPELCMSATVRMAFTCERAIVRGTRGLWGTFAGFDARASVRKHKFSGSRNDDARLRSHT